MPDEPPQQPQLKPQLRLRSVPTAVDPAFGWRFLRHERYDAGRDVVLAAVRVHVRDDPDLARIHVGLAGPRVSASWCGEVERHLDREVLAGVLAGGEQDLGLGLVGGDVVGDLDRRQITPLVGLMPIRWTLTTPGCAAAIALISRRHLGVVVVAGVGAGEVGGAGAREDLEARAPERLEVRSRRRDRHRGPVDLDDRRAGAGDRRALGLRADMLDAVRARFRRGRGA